jgi:hypothetical protein
VPTLKAGWTQAGKSLRVNLKEGKITFKQVRQIPRLPKTKRKTNEITKPFTPVPVRSTKRKEPSKTKVSKLYARILNMERNRNQSCSNTLGFKPRSTYEKRLFGSDKKPQNT